MSKDVVTTKDFNKAKEEWLKKKAESNKKAQEDLKDHIEKKKSKKSIIGLSMKIKKSEPSCEGSGFFYVLKVSLSHSIH